MKKSKVVKGKKFKSMRDEKYKHPYKDKTAKVNKAKKIEDKKRKDNTKISSALFMNANVQLKPPYNILIDTNFVKFAQQGRLEIEREAMTALCGTVKLFVTDCVFAELELLKEKAKLALEVLKSQPINRLKCLHKGTYADDCIVDRVTQHKCYIVATSDKDLLRRIAKVPGVPTMMAKRGKFSVFGMGNTVSNMNI